MASIGPTWRAQVADIPRAFGLLTRLPLPVDGSKAVERGAQAAWAFPIVGMVLGLIFVWTTQIMLVLGMTTVLAVTLGLALIAFVTGAMHEDALADVLDGFWGGWDKEKRLTIMKDSNIGVYGVLGLVFLTLVKVQGYAHVIDTAPVMALGLFSLSRAVMVPVMAFIPNARGTGLSHSVGVPHKTAVFIACVLGGGVAVFTLPFWSIPVLCASTFALVKIAERKIGGQTGDVLGAIQNVGEVSALLAVICLT